MDLERLFQTLTKIIEQKEGVKIKYELERREDNGIYVCQESQN